VDDEPRVLDGLKLHLRRHYLVQTATSGAEGLKIIDNSPQPFAVVLSDMRMPEMNGAVFLREVRQRVPDTVRMLLTGQADFDAAIAAVNEGQLFRFLTKPCPPETLLAAFASAAAQYRLINAERVLLEQTLRGIIKTLTDILSLTNPVAFSRAGRIRRHAVDLAQQLGVPPDWQLEVAAMLSQLSCIILPQDTLDKLYQGEMLNDRDQRMVGRLPAVTEQLLGGIPRLETVLAMLQNQRKPYRFDPQAIDPARLGGQILRLASDFDTLISQGYSIQAALDVLRSKREVYDEQIVAAFAAIRDPSATQRMEVREISIMTLKPGMVLAEDVITVTGALLVARGQETTPSLVERLQNFQETLKSRTAKVLLPVED
jgi:response regulator RpfG family c-di-GMP phosphodiesterase